MFENLFNWLDTSVGALAKRVLQSLGIGWLSFNGITELMTQIRDHVLENWASMPPEMVAIISMAGFGTAFGIIFGALMYRAAMAALGRLGRIITT